MSQNPLIDVLEANRLLRSPDEVARFEQTLEKLAQNPDPADLPSLHLILDDACEQPEVMFSMVNFLESFNAHDQVQAFIQILPDLVKRSEEWTAILHSRMMNDATLKAEFEETVRSMETTKQHEIYSLIFAPLKSELENRLATHFIDFSKVLEKYGYSERYTISFQINPASTFARKHERTEDINRENTSINLNADNLPDSVDIPSVEDVKNLGLGLLPLRLVCEFIPDPPYVNCHIV